MKNKEEACFDLTQGFMFVSKHQIKIEKIIDWDK